jgi:methylenetetrahydrofolate dehydrogenase (NADP+)/methenyltetrahydrofolate cyclohydrolase
MPTSSETQPPPPADPRIMQGSALARRLRASIAVAVGRVRETSGVVPTLATVLVGDDPASAAYVRMKRRRCAEAGMGSRHVELARGTSTDQLLAALGRLADDPDVHGILLQHPVPDPIDRRAAFEAIPLAKDVDGVTSTALGRLILGMPAFPACTPAGIMRLLRHYAVELEGAHAVVLGRSPILGRPMASMLINAHATVTLCHSRTRNLPDLVSHADILIAAAGRPRFVRGEWIRSGAVVIDAGYNPGNVGDVDFDSALPRARWITPVPGGVGPMTIAMLLLHTVQAAAQQRGLPVADEPEAPGR